MALNPSTNGTMSGRITAPDASYPYGSSKDETSAGAGDGTPYFKARADDIFGFQQWLLNQAGIVPSGTADTALVSQYGDALKYLIDEGRSYAKITDTKASGVDGGTFTSGVWQRRTLNTKDSDDDLIVTLAGGQVTLQAGKYRIKASAPGYEVGAHKIRLRNITDGTTEIVGSSAYFNFNLNVMTHSFLSGEITIVSAKTFELQHHCQTTDLSGFGVDLSGDGENAVYATIEIWRV